MEFLGVGVSVECEGGCGESGRGGCGFVVVEVKEEVCWWWWWCDLSFGVWVLGFGFFLFRFLVFLVGFVRLSICLSGSRVFRV